MKVAVTAASLHDAKADGLVVGVFSDHVTAPHLRALDRLLKGALSHAVKTDAFSGKGGQTLAVDTMGSLPARKVLFVGLGEKDKATAETLRRGMGNALRSIKRAGLATVATDLATVSIKGVTPEAAAQAVAEAAILSVYTFDALKSEKTPPHVKQTLLVAGKHESRVRVGVRRGIAVAEAACWARDLVNLPGNALTPTYLADEAKKMARSHKIACTVFDPARIKKEKMGGLMAVAQGSAEPARFIILEWLKGPKSHRPIVLVGKGLTFDTGGISIKPSANMEEMKTDMSGAAGMLATIRAVAALNLKVNLVVLVPSTENMPSGTAIKPGDVATALSGVTMEIVNTDAEGRLILADGLAYAERYKPDCVVDMATLTGACVVALGLHASGLFGSDETLVEQLRAAGEATGERLWPMPLWPEYEEQIKSDVADIKNVGSKGGGAITAAAFLKRHVKSPWAHIDIAGTAYNDTPRHYLPKGGVGVGVRALVAFVEARAGSGK
jgi:leucyl aminopeptidase